MEYTISFFKVVFEIMIASLFQAVKFVMSSTNTTLMFYMDIGHWGVRKTYDLVAMKFLIKRMKLLIVEFVQTRPLCKRITPNRLATQGLF